MPAEGAADSAVGTWDIGVQAPCVAPDTDERAETVKSKARSGGRSLVGKPTAPAEISWWQVCALCHTGLGEKSFDEALEDKSSRATKLVSTPLSSPRTSDVFALDVLERKKDPFFFCPNFVVHKVNVFILPPRQKQNVPSSGFSCPLFAFRSRQVFLWQGQSFTT